jgi:hypothetical protein
MILSDLGADVLRIQNPARGARSPELERTDLTNRGRRSVGLDLRQSQAVEAVLTLVEKADAFPLRDFPAAEPVRRYGKRGLKFRSATGVTMRSLMATENIMLKEITSIGLAIAILATVLACAQPQQADPLEPIFSTGDTYAEGNTARPWTHLDFDNDPDDFQFAVITDRTGGHRPGVFPAIMKRTNLLQPEFIMSVGDYIEGYSRDKNRLRSEWAKVDGMISVLDAPLFFVVGNHDVANEAMEDVWRERAAKTQYHFVYKNVLFLILNTEDPAYPTHEVQDLYADAMVFVEKGDMASAIQLSRENPMLENYVAESGKVMIGDAQADWATSVLDEYKDVRWTFVFLHRPLWTHPTPNFTRIEQALQGRGFTMMAGHVHNYTYEQRQGQDFISMGTNGGIWSSSPKPGEMDHITWVSMNKDGPTFANLVATGILAKDEIPETISGAEFCGEFLDLPCLYNDRPPAPVSLGEPE